MPFFSSNLIIRCEYDLRSANQLGSELLSIQDRSYRRSRQMPRDHGLGHMNLIWLKMAAVSLLLVAAAIGLFTYWIYKLEKVRRNIDKLGGPKSLPIIGNIHQLKRKPDGKIL